MPDEAAAENGKYVTVLLVLLGWQCSFFVWRQCMRWPVHGHSFMAY